MGTWVTIISVSGEEEGRALNGNYQCIAGGELFTQTTNLDSLFQPPWYTARRNEWGADRL